MFDAIAQKSHRALDDQIAELKKKCDSDPAISELVEYVLASFDAEISGYNQPGYIGDTIIYFIFQICGIDLHGIASESSECFDTAWAQNLNYFIDNYILDDFSFDFSLGSQNVFEFMHSKDDGRNLRDPRILIEAAKANMNFYVNLERDKLGRPLGKVDTFEVFKLLREKESA